MGFSPATNNIAPANTTERLFAISVVLTALGLLTSLASSIAAYSTQIQAMHAAQTRAETLVRTFFTSRRLSSDLCCRIKVFMKRSGQKHKYFQHEDDVPLLKQMPETLQIRLHAELYMPVFLSSGLFKLLRGTESPFLVRACHVVFKEKSVPPRSDVFIEHTF